jgi:hypothetical protein
MGRWWDVTLALALAITSAVESAVYERRVAGDRQWLRRVCAVERCVGIVSSQRCAISIAGVSASDPHRGVRAACGGESSTLPVIGCAVERRWDSGSGTLVRTAPRLMPLTLGRARWKMEG